MRALTTLGLVWLAGCNCSRGPVTAIDPQPVRVSPAELDFGRAFVGFPQRRSIQLFNPNRVEVALAFAVTAPFSLPSAPTRLAGADSVSIEVEFNPTQPGDARRFLHVNDAGVLLTGAGAAVPDCDAGAACFIRAFDADAGRCVEHDLPDGLDCTGSSACFVKASCQQGECLGTLTTCDDANPCTLEVCGAGGCGHLDGLSSCPEPDDPCLVPTCDPKTGCGIAPALDGTSCGPRSCAEANVCINGQCVLRPAPQNQACTDVLAGVPAGQGASDGPPAVARFRSPVAAAYDGQGNLYVLDGCAIRKVSPSGLVRTIAGVVDECAPVNGAGLAARLNYPTAMAFDGTALFIREGCQLRRVSLSGLVTPFVGNPAGCEIVDGIGAQASLGYGSLAYEPHNRKLLLLDREASASDPQDSGFWLREVSRATGEVVTLAPLKTRPPLPPNNEIAQLDTLAVTSDGGIFGCVLESRIADDTSYSGPNFLVQLDRDGVSRNVYEGDCLGVTGAGPSVLINYVSWIEEWTGAQKLPVAGQLNGYLDGPLSVARFNFLSALAVNDAGIAAVDANNYNLRLIRAGQVTTLAGPRPDRQVVDGPAGVSRLLWPVALAARPDGGVVFLDSVLLRQLDAAGTVSTLVGSSLSSGQIDGPFATASLASPTSVAIWGDAAWISEWVTMSDFSTWVSLRRADLTTGVVTTPSTFVGGYPLLASHQYDGLSLRMAGQVWEVSPLGVPTARTPDGGAYYYYGSTLAPDGVGGWYLGANTMLLHAGDGGVISAVVDNPASRSDGTSAVAGFGYITGMVVDATGDLYLSDYNRVRRYRPSTDTVTTLFELSDAPIGLDLEPGGTLVVLVPNAILRLKP